MLQLGVINDKATDAKQSHKSIVLHPSALFLRLIATDPISPESTLDNLVKIREKVEKVKSHIGNLRKESVLGSIPAFYQIFQSDLKHLVHLIRFNINLSAFARSENTRFAQPHIDQLSSRQLTTMYRLQEVEQLINSVKDLLVLERHTEANIDQWEEELRHKVERACNDLELLSGFAIFGKHPTSGSYIYDCQFQPNAARLEKLIFDQDDETTRYKALVELRNQIEQGTHWEYFYLAALIQAKSNAFHNAHYLIEQGLNICILKTESELAECEKRFNFLRNLVWIREGRIGEALKEGERLSDKYGGRDPRFDIQLAYIMLFDFLRMTKGHMKRNLSEEERRILQEAIPVAERASETSRLDLPEYRRCNRLALADLAIFYCHRWDLERARFYLNEMENALGDAITREPIVFKLARAMVQLLNASLLNIESANRYSVLDEVRNVLLGLQDTLNTLEEVRKSIDKGWHTRHIGITMTEIKNEMRRLEEATARAGFVN